MKNQKLRQKKLAKNKMKRTHHNKVYDQRQRCKKGSRLVNQREQNYTDHFNALKNQMGI